MFHDFSSCDPTETFHFSSSDGLSIACARWNAKGTARGTIQISHGMGEHIGRYSEIIALMVEAGFNVWANDHRGHGFSVSSSQHIGDLGEGGFNLLVEDMFTLCLMARKQAPTLPLILMGHSMGSFAAQQFILSRSSEIDGLILSGSGILDGLVALAATSGLEILNANFEPTRTPADWLSRDASVVDAFLADPLCFPQLNPASMDAYLSAASTLADPVNLSGIRSDLPIYIFSGAMDPVGMQTKGVKELVNRYSNAGVVNITVDFYDEGRHEMLHDFDHEAVKENLLNWSKSISNSPIYNRGDK